MPAVEDFIGTGIMVGFLNTHLPVWTTFPDSLTCRLKNSKFIDFISCQNELFCSFSSAGIIESDDINIIHGEMNKAYSYSQNVSCRGFG